MNLDIAKLKKIKWFYGAARGKNHAVLFIDAVGTIAVKERYPEGVYGFPYVGKYYLQCAGSRSIGEEDHRAMEKILDELYKKNPGFFYEWGIRMAKIGRSIRAWTDTVKEVQWRALGNADLAQLVSTHCDWQAQIWAVPLAYAYYFYFNDKIVEKFMKEIRGRLGDKLDALLPAILAQDKISEIAEEKLELLKLALKVLELGVTSEKKLEKHWKKFAYLNNYYYWGNGYSLEDMRTRLAEEVKKGKKMIKKEVADIEPKKFDYGLFTDQEALIIKSMKKLSHAFQYADESLAYAIHHIRGVYNEVAKRLGINYNLLVSMTLSEITDSLDKNKLSVSVKELENRYRNHVVVVTEGESTILTRKDCALYEEFVAEKINTGIKEFKGVIAFKGGLLKGKVHIISHADEIASFKKGEILVTAMTNPSFVPAMQKALAIITNDGGLLCHAAIVSREMKKPCIIGTKIATKVLKDGDMVEVDANSGIVKIIK